MNDCGEVVTDEHFMTKISGIFAAGDVRAGSIKQVATAVGEGVSVAIAIARFLDKK